MLKDGEHLAALGERDEKRLDPFAGPTKAPEQLVDVAGPRPLADDLRPAPGLHEDGVLLLLEPAEERGQRHVERRGKALERRQAGGCLRIFDLGQHSLGDAAALGQLPDVQPELLAALPDVVGDHPSHAPRSRLLDLGDLRERRDPRALDA